ncbi:MAG TPA: site-specific DNA-methyltransferase [bacterium]|nr:site-specific DNA-methyltransferase [bacterium]
MKPYYKQKDIIIYCGDSLQVMPELEKVDMVLTDVPYEKTKSEWDVIIPMEQMWEQIRRIKKEKCAIVMTAAQPFTSLLICSNLGMFKYTWVWEKPHAKGHLNAKKRPMVAHEDVCVFYDIQPVYNPQMTHGHERKTATRRKECNSEVYNNNTKTVSYDSTSRYPRSVQVFKQDTQKTSLHPNQKPVALMEYLVRTYTNEGDTVLDIAMGSATVGVACQNTGRKFIGIDSKAKYCDISCRRLGLNN